MYQKLLLSEKIAENITDLILKDFYRAGDKLPNELELSEALNISRATLREAFKVLESRNVIEVRRGIGTFISEIPGLSQDALGKRFIDPEINKGDFVEVLGYCAELLIRRYPFLERSVKERVLDQLMTADAYAIEKLLKALDEIAKSSDSEYIYRMWRMHLSMWTHFTLKTHSIDSVQYEQFCEALSNEALSSAMTLLRSMISTLK